MKKNEDRMEANMTALVKQKELDQQQREKVSKKRMFEDISDYNSEQKQREEINAGPKRIKLQENPIDYNRPPVLQEQ